MKFNLNTIEEELPYNIITIEELIEYKKNTAKVLVMRINGKIILRDNWNTTIIKNGDFVIIKYNKVQY